MTGTSSDVVVSLSVGFIVVVDVVITFGVEVTSVVLTSSNPVSSALR